VLFSNNAPKTRVLSAWQDKLSYGRPPLAPFFENLFLKEGKKQDLSPFPNFYSDKASFLIDNPFPF
jgi:hypothetical protein